MVLVLIFAVLAAVWGWRWGWCISLHTYVPQELGQASFAAGSLHLASLSMIVSMAPTMTATMAHPQPYPPYPSGYPSYDT